MRVHQSIDRLLESEGRIGLLLPGGLHAAGDDGHHPVLHLLHLLHLGHHLGHHSVGMVLWCIEGPVEWKVGRLVVWEVGRLEVREVTLVAWWRVVVVGGVGRWVRGSSPAH